MRLWTIHPRYLDKKGLLALWREGLLAQKVLAGKTKGYIHHPQLERFKKRKEGEIFLSLYLYEIFLEAKKRGYDFDETKILQREKIGKNFLGKISVQKGQIEYEFSWLKKKLTMRDRKKLKELEEEKCKKIEIFSIFKEVAGGVEKWEKEKQL